MNHQDTKTRSGLWESDAFGESPKSATETVALPKPRRRRVIFASPPSSRLRDYGATSKSLIIRLKPAELRLQGGWFLATYEENSGFSTHFSPVRGLISRRLRRNRGKIKIERNRCGPMRLQKQRKETKEVDPEILRGWPRNTRNMRNSGGRA